MYTAIYGVMAFLGLIFRDRRTEYAVLFLAMVFLVLFMGTRYYVGCDYGGYLSRYENMSTHATIGSAIFATEPGFNLLMWFVVTERMDFMWVNLFSSMIMLGCYWYFLREFRNPMTILALLFPIVFLQLGMSGLRQGIAVSMIAAASVPFLNGKRWQVLAWVLLAAQFHTSAYMFLPIAALVGTRVTFGKATWAIMALLPFVLWFLADRLSVYQDRYVNEIYGDQSSGGAVFRYLLMLPAALLFFLNLDKLKARFPKKFELLKTWSLGIIALAPLTVLSTFALHRISYYFMPLNIVTFVYVSMVTFRRKEVALGLLIPPLFYGIYTIGWQSMSSHFRACYVPYQSVLF